MGAHISYAVPETYLCSLELMVHDIPSNKLFTHVKKYDFNFRGKKSAIVHMKLKKRSCITKVSLHNKLSVIVILN